MSAPKYSLDGLRDLLRNYPRQPVGYIVSRAVFDGLRTLPSAPIRTAIGVSIVMDPDLPEAEFEAVFELEVWTRRLREIAAKPLTTKDHGGQAC